MGERTWLYGLTADEWFHLASEGEHSEVAPCCGNIGAIRDILRELLVFQDPDEVGWRIGTGRELLRLMEGDADEHGLQDRKAFPLLHKVLDGVRCEQELGVLACKACTAGEHGSCDHRHCTCARCKNG